MTDLARPRRRPRVLVIDVGGSHVKAIAHGQTSRIRIPTGPACTAEQMVASVREATATWEYDVVSLGFPGPVVDGKLIAEPRNLGGGWVDFDFAAAFERPVRVINDAAMQALGGYSGGRMLFMGLGTGLGTAIVVEGHLQPLELAHLPYRKKKSYEELVGEAARDDMGTPKWRRIVYDVTARFMDAMQTQSLLLGGGNARRLRKYLDRLPAGTRLGSNADAFRGGFRLWAAPEDRARVSSPSEGAEVAET